MKRTVLSIFIFLFCVGSVLPVYAQDRGRQRRPPESRDRAVPRERPRHQPRYRQDQRHRGNYGYNNRRHDRGYNSRYNLPLYYPQYDGYNYGRNHRRFRYPRCTPDLWYIVGYDWYGYPVYNVIYGNCY